jgi:hypothetical protein
MMSKEESKRLVEKIYPDVDNRYGNWGWCSLDKAGCIIDCVDEIFNRVKNPICVEIGVYAGKSVIPVALELKRMDSGKLYAIDPWDNIEATKDYEDKDFEFWSKVDMNRIYEIFKTVLEENGCTKYVEIIKKPSDDAPVIHGIDFLYIDGQHTSQALRDAKKYASQVNVGGYCIVDDIDWGEVSLVPTLVKSMGFEEVRWIDGALIFKRVEYK